MRRDVGPDVHRRVLDTSVVWPPLRTPDDPADEPVMVAVWGGYERATGRPVRLWGKRVLIDDSGAVYCDGCRRFVPLEDLVAADNAHPVGLRPIPGALLDQRPVSGS